MDEHLFLIMAKLKADRLQFEREQAMHLAAPSPAPVQTDESGSRVDGGNRSVIRTLEWSEQS